MTDFDKGLELYDRPEILYRLFFPRREIAADTDKAVNHYADVAPGIRICCRFFPVRNDAANIIYFHGNGEIAADYDYVAPVYAQYGLNLFVTDYRGYGGSNGTPTCSAMIKDAHPVFRYFRGLLKEAGYTGDLFAMGRSLGSAPAIELASRYQDILKGLIIESGFASARNQIGRLGVEYLFDGAEEPVGFGNDMKIKDVRIPTLIIHGEWDEIIPATEGRHLYELSGAQEKFSLFIRRAGHNDIMYYGMEQYMDAVRSFINKYYN
ncbi:MAG: alpha/beta hydrolase [Syntrophorhabdaceae bacterium]|nr:alpha/beta hydrolase [Syntrophorhabdaceae bacterium]MDD4195594.1 alpha/beta hydrolase [Syntrophorhabdaceae bacterium]HOC46227.1 alpha/beta hydrolase [Syntrophorhabdaceae bacterium]